MGFIRKYLSLDGLLEGVRETLYEEKLPKCRSKISWQDCIMSGLAIFGLKFPSLLQFEETKEEPVIKGNLRNLYHVKNTPSDTCLRERLDEVSPDVVRKSFTKIFAYLQRGKVLDHYKFLDQYYILSIDGTGQYSSSKVHCKNCCEKHHRNGEVTYYHQMVGASIVHPEQKIVIPIAPEPIVKSDGNNKNDCERNATQRLLEHFRREHHKLKTIVVEDGLGSNHPHLSLLDRLQLQYIIGVKEGDHKYLYEWINQVEGEKIEITKNKVRHKFRYIRDVPLNDEHYDYRVTVVEYWEEKPNGKQQYFSWVTSLEVSKENVYQIMRAGRSRWKIENETFNTLKNQGYNFEHNYGHGNKNLCSVMTMLMLLAFLIDQVINLCWNLRRKLRKKLGPWYAVYENIRSMFTMIIWDNWVQMYNCLLKPELHPPPNWYGMKIKIESN